MTEAPSPVGALVIGSAWQKAEIVRIVPRTPRIKSLFLRLPRPFVPVAGQHVDLKLTAPDGYSAMRSYSIASAPSLLPGPGSGVIELAIDLMDEGEISPFFHEVAAVGDEIELKGPLGGHFVWRVRDGGPLLLIGGGSGLVPLMAMVRQRHAARSTVPAALLLSARTWDDALYRDELFELGAQGDDFAFTLALTREPTPRAGVHHRRIDPALVAEVAGKLPAPPRHVFICGSNAFVSAASDAALAAGIPVGIVRTERYGE